MFVAQLSGEICLCCQNLACFHVWFPLCDTPRQPRIVLKASDWLSVRGAKEGVPEGCQGGLIE